MSIGEAPSRRSGPTLLLWTVCVDLRPASGAHIDRSSLGPGVEAGCRQLICRLRLKDGNYRLRGKREEVLTGEKEQ